MFHMLEFPYRPQVFYGFHRKEGKTDGTLIEWERNADVLVAISSPPHFVREECC